MSSAVSTIPNPHEEAARFAKAAKLASVLAVSGAYRGQVLSEETRALALAAANIESASEETWTIVADILPPKAIADIVAARVAFRGDGRVSL